MLKTRPVEEVVQIIKDRFGSARMGIEQISAVEFLGRVLAEDIKAVAFIPNFDRATVDGYAVKVEDIKNCSDVSPAKLKLIGKSSMGEHTPLQLQTGQCAYVPTGGELPSGTEAMVMLEYTKKLEDDFVEIYKSCVSGENMIFRGEDMKPGDLVIPSGKQLKIADTGTLAAMGIMKISAMKRPRVGIISTGDELVSADSTLSKVGLIRDANAPMLRHAIQANNAIPRDYGIVKDDSDAIKTLVKKAIDECDLLLISGGTSMDSRDAVTVVIEDHGEVIVHGVTLKPGKPTIFGSIQGKPVFGLPGNPVSVYFTFHLFVRPLLYSLQGIQPVDHKMKVKLSRTFVTNHGREEYVPIILKDGEAQPVASKSGLITTVSCADGFIRVPRNWKGIEQGEIVEVTLLEK